MKAKLTYSVTYDVDALIPEIEEKQGDHPMTMTAIDEFLKDRFISYTDGTIDVSTSDDGFVTRSLNVEYYDNAKPYDPMEQFEAIYCPVPNHLDSHASWDGYMFETYGDQLAYVRQQPLNNVWTIIEEDGCQYIVTGYRIVNRLGYFITNYSWESSKLSFKIF